MNDIFYHITSASLSWNPFIHFLHTLHSIPSPDIVTGWHSMFDILSVQYKPLSSKNRYPHSWCHYTKLYSLHPHSVSIRLCHWPEGQGPLPPSPRWAPDTYVLKALWVNLHSGTWGMARSSILLKNLTRLEVGNVLGDKNLLIFGTINVTIHLTDLPGTSVFDVTPNHNLSTSKFDCLLGETVGPDGPLRVVDNIGGAWDGAQLMIHLKNPIFCCPTLCQTVGLGVRNTVS